MRKKMRCVRRGERGKGSRCFAKQASLCPESPRSCTISSTEWCPSFALYMFLSLRFCYLLNRCRYPQPYHSKQTASRGSHTRSGTHQDPCGYVLNPRATHTRPMTVHEMQLDKAENEVRRRKRGVMLPEFPPAHLRPFVRFRRRVVDERQRLCFIVVCTRG